MPPRHYRQAGNTTDSTGTLAELGLIFRPRIGGDNTAYYIPEGILLAYGSGNFVAGSVAQRGSMCST